MRREAIRSDRASHLRTYIPVRVRKTGMIQTTTQEQGAFVIAAITFSNARATGLCSGATEI